METIYRVTPKIQIGVKFQGMPNVHVVQEKSISTVAESK